MIYSICELVGLDLVCAKTVQLLYVCSNTQRLTKSKRNATRKLPTQRSYDDCMWRCADDDAFLAVVIMMTLGQHQLIRCDDAMAMNA